VAAKLTKGQRAFCF